MPNDHIGHFWLLKSIEGHRSFNVNIYIYIYIYIYNMRTYGCTSMLTFILNVLGEVLGIGNLYCRLFYSAGSRPCVRPRNFENRLLNDVLSELWTSSSAANRETDIYSTSGRRAKRQLLNSAQQVIDFAPHLLQ